MKKVIFLLGLVLGFFAGSRMGRGPYESLESTARQIADDPTVQKKASDAKESAEGLAQRAKDRAPEVADSVKGAAAGAATAVKDRATHRADDASGDDEGGESAKAGSGASSSAGGAGSTSATPDGPAGSTPDTTSGGDGEVGDKPLSA
ncbi:hypothetical protein [Brachybacterium subflavum]|uniref:hypothetical protein n=1 Tax=Brachybacterium subflavum TaxID=2585206 RepID=UPI00126650BF|nr:hypothetical protein [Brachybacterium subflavum]